MLVIILSVLAVEMACLIYLICVKNSFNNDVANGFQKMDSDIKSIAQENYSTKQSLFATLDEMREIKKHIMNIDLELKSKKFVDTLNKAATVKEQPSRYIRKGPKKSEEAKRNASEGAKKAWAAKRARELAAHEATLRSQSETEIVPEILNTPVQNFAAP